MTREGVVLSFDGARRGCGTGAVACVLSVRDETGAFEKVGHGGRVLRDTTAIMAEREALLLTPKRDLPFECAVENQDTTRKHRLDQRTPSVLGPDSMLVTEGGWSGMLLSFAIWLCPREGLFAEAAE